MISRQLEALRKQLVDLAKLPTDLAKQEALKQLVGAGILTRQGKLATHYR